MATQVNALSQGGVDAAALLQYLRFCDKVIEQLKKGATSLTVPITAITPLGIEAVDALKERIEEATGARFAATVNAAANTVTLTAMEPMPAGPPAGSADPVGDMFVDGQHSAVASGALGAGSSASTSTSSTRTRKGIARVPRPKNAFMIFRLDWHPIIAAENPGMHNNDISKIIGGLWKAESQRTRDAYKERAEQEKREHAIAHPGYQYQPRKPSEKKKRMTKNKLARLAAESGTGDAGDANASLQAQSNANDRLGEIEAYLREALQDEQITVDTFEPPYQIHTSQLTTYGGTNLPSFKVGLDESGDAEFCDQLMHLPGIAGVDPGADAIIAAPLANGMAESSIPSEDIFLTYDIVANETALDMEIADEWVSGLTGVDGMGVGPYGEQGRQDQLDMSEFFDFADAAGDVPSGLGEF